MTTWLLWHVAILPALVSALVLAATWPIGRRTGLPIRLAWTNALALVSGYVIGHVGLEGWRPFPPREATDWLWYFAFLAVLLSLLDVWRSYPLWMRWVLHASLWLAIVWVLLPPSIRKESGRSEIAAWLIGLSSLGFSFWLSLDASARRLPGAMLPLILLIVSAGSAGVLHYSRSLKLTELAAILAASLLPILGRTLLRPPMALAVEPVTVLLPGLWLTSYFYDYKPPNVAILLLLAAATQTALLVSLPGLGKSASRHRPWICVAAALVLVAWAVSLAHRASNEAENLLPADL